MFVENLNRVYQTLSVCCESKPSLSDVEVFVVNLNRVYQTWSVCCETKPSIRRGVFVVKLNRVSDVECLL